MADMKDNLFGTLAVRGHFVLPDQINEALAIQLQFEQGGQKPPRMGEILAAKGYMTPEQVQAVLRGQGSPQGKMFGQVASAWHFCAQEDVDSAVAFQQEQRSIGQRAPRIGEILVSRGAMKPHQIRAVLQAQGKQIVMCPTCGTRYNAVNVSAGAKLKCPRCQVVFVPFSSTTRPDEDVRADITVSLPAIKVGDSATNQPAKMEVGGYQLGAKLGMDHSGILYKALHPQTGNHVALRLLSSQVMQGAEEFDMWVSAGQTATELNHPNLQRILSMGSEGGRAYLVMEFVEGKSLRARLNDANRLQPLEALEIMIQVGDALAYGHARDLIHGDLRPNHILIGLDGRVRLSGLGTPKQVMKDLRLMAEKSGSVPLYTAPEVIISEESADEQSDIYNLCAIGYHMITGKPPMEGNDVLQAGMRIASQDVALPRSLDPGIAPYLERLLLKGLSADQEDRYPSIVALLADLRKCRGGLLIQANDLPEVASEIRPGAPKAMRAKYRGARQGRRLTTHLVRRGSGRKGSGAHMRPGSKSGLTPAVKSSGIHSPVKSSGLYPSTAATSGMHPSSARGSGLNPSVKRSGDLPKVLSPEEAMKDWGQMIGPASPSLSAALEPNTAAMAAVGHDVQPFTNLTPTAQSSVDGQKKKRKAPREQEIAPTTIISVILGSAAVLLFGLWLITRNNGTASANNTPETNPQPTVIEKEAPEKEMLRQAQRDYASMVEGYQKVNTKDFKGLLRMIDQYTAKYEKSEPLPPQVGTAKALRKKVAAEGAADALPVLRDILTKMAAEDRYNEAAGELAKWRNVWGDAATEMADAEAKTLDAAELSSANTQFEKVKVLREKHDFATAMKLCDDIARKYSPTIAARAKEEKAQIERADTDINTTAKVEEERKRQEQIKAEKDKAAPGRYDDLVKSLHDPLKTLDLTLASALIDQSSDLLVGTPKGPDLQALKTEFKLYQGLRTRMANAAHEGKFRDYRVRYQGETVNIIDATDKGPVVNVKGGRVDAKWNELEAEALLEIVRRVTSQEKGDELQMLGMFLLLHDLPFDAERTLKAAKAQGAVVNDLLDKAAARQKEIASTQQKKTEDEPGQPGRWTAPSYVKLPVGAQNDGVAKAMTDMGWEISKGNWIVTSEKTLFGEKPDDLALVSLKRDLKRFANLSVEMRGHGDALGFSFGKGLRFLVKPSGRWQKFGLEIGAGDLVKFSVDGNYVKSIEDTGEVNSEKLGDAMYLRCEGSHMEVRDFKVDGKAAGSIEVPWSMIAEAAKKNTLQRPADTDRLKAWGWEVSEGIWSVQPEQSWVGVPNATSSMSNLKREIAKFSSMSVDVRGDADAAGFSFGKGMRYLIKPNGKWQTLRLEVIVGDLLRMTVNGDSRKSIEDTSSVKTTDLPGIAYLRGQGGVVEFRNFMVDGHTVGGEAKTEAVKTEKPEKEDERKTAPAAAQDPKDTEALKKAGWEISKGVWKVGADNIYQGLAAEGSTLISLKGALKRFGVITVEMRGDADAAGFSFGTGMRFVLKPSDRWQTVKLLVVEGDHLQLQVDGEGRNSLEDTSKVTSDQFGDTMYLRAEGQKIEFRNFKME